MNFILRWIGYALSVILIAYFVPGISIDSFIGALWVAIVLGFINTFIRPILMLLMMPINLMTLGLFALVLNALLMMLAGYLVAGFTVNGFWSALIGAIAFSIITSWVNWLTKK